MQAALYTNGRCVTGVNHGDAFTKLTEREKDDCTSGFYDQSTGRFVSEDAGAFYVKRVILVRHGEYETPCLTKLGLTQARNTALFLSQLDLNGYTFLSSPYRRCQQTAAVIAGFTGHPFVTLEALGEQTFGQTVADFKGRVRECLDALPNFAVCVTHSDVVWEGIQLTCGATSVDLIPYGSVTYIDNGRPVWVGRRMGEES